jgi:ABC-type transport system substrate-binding protein
MYTPTNITKAKQLLTAAGYPNGVDITIWFTNVIVGSPDVEALIQEQLARSGIRAKLNSQETGAFYSRFRGGEFESAVGQMSADYLDADSTASFIAASTGSYAKRVRLNDTIIDNLVKQGVATTDPAQRAKIYGDIQDRLAALCVYVPIVNILDLWFYRNNVSGVQSYYFQYSPWWTLDKSAPAT